MDFRRDLHVIGKPPYYIYTNLQLSVVLLGSGQMFGCGDRVGVSVASGLVPNERFCPEWARWWYTEPVDKWWDYENDENMVWHWYLPASKLQSLREKYQASEEKARWFATILKRGDVLL